MTTTADLDRREAAWWDANAALMERVWTLPGEVSRTLRSGMARRAAAFFGEGTILEPGCGAGWPGRLVAQASDGVRIVGTDASGEQIKLARAEADRAGLSDRCRYFEADMSALELDDYDGAFFHAALHHLSETEVETVLDRLATAPPGFRIVLYEPVFVDTPSVVPGPVGRAATLALGLAIRALAPRPTDPELASAVGRLEREAREMGWFLSPKEVPFERSALLARLGQRFEIAFAEPMHLAAIEVGQAVAAAGPPYDLRRLRLAMWLDRLLLGSRLYRLCAGRYSFWLIGLVRPPTAWATADANASSLGP